MKRNFAASLLQEYPGWRAIYLSPLFNLLVPNKIYDQDKIE